ncbi:MAG: redoxin domain-containing protein [Deferrisomatales bacterium]
MTVRVGALLACLAGALLGPGCTSEPGGGGLRERTDANTVTAEVNAKAPAFAAYSLDGEVVRLADYLGSHVVLLEFWSIFCKSCLEEMPGIQDLHRRYADRGLAVLSVNTDLFSSQKVSSFLDKTGLRPPFPVVRDPRQEIAKAFNVELLPVTVLVDRDGWIRLYQEGYKPGDEARFEAKLTSLLGRQPEAQATLAPRGGVTAFAPAGAELAQPGQRAGPFEAALLGGGPADLADGRPRLFYFWSLYCRPCRAEYPAVAALAGRFRGGLSAFSVNVDTVRLGDRARAFAQDHPGLPCVADDPEQGSRLSASLGVRATPALVLLDRDGVVRYAEAGTADLAALEAKIRALGVGE